MFVIPISHEGLRVRRLPWVTISIAVICVLAQLFTWGEAEWIEGRVETTAVQVRLLVEEVAADCARRTCADVESGDFAEILEALREELVGSLEQQRQLKMLEYELLENLESHPSWRFGFQPAEPTVLTLFTSMFVHGGFMHLAGNLLFLYLVGLGLEDRWGRWRVLVLFLAGGVVATGSYTALHPDGELPVVGASGAIAALMGAFMVLFGADRIRFLYVFFFLRTGTFSVPAFLVLPLWLAKQLISISAETSGTEPIGYSAHAGGFIFGAAAAALIRVVGWDAKFRESSDIAASAGGEHPRLAAARVAFDCGDLARAQLELSHYLTNHPADVSAHELGLRLAEQRRAAAALARHAAVVFPLWAGSDPKSVLASFRTLLELLDGRPVDLALLDPVLSAALKLHDLELAQWSMRHLFQREPSHPSTAKALWVIAEIHGAQGHRDVQATLLDRIVRDHAQTEWAVRAGARLRQATL